MPRILVVDDVAQNRYILQVLFSGHGYEIETADNGAVAIEKARLHPPDLVITDLLMPVMDGFELCRQWQRDPRLRSIPIVIYTATYTEEKDIEFGLSLGARLYLKKPLEPEALLRVIGDLFKQAGSQTAPKPAGIIEDELEYLRKHKQLLARKLENKIAALNAANEALRLEKDELRQSEARLRAITENTTVYLYEIAPNGIIEYANRTYPDLLFSQVIGSHLLDWFPEEQRPAVQSLLDAVMASGQAQATEYTIPDPQGHLRSYSTSFSPVIDNGIVQRVILTAIDVSDRKQIEQSLRTSEERFDLAMRGSSDGLWDWDIPAGRTYYSPRWKEMIGYRADEIGDAREEWGTRIHPADLEGARAALDAHLQGLTPSYEATYRFRHKQGHYLWILGRGLALRDASGKPNRVVGTHVDITQRVETERELVRHRKHLQALIDERTHDLGQALKELSIFRWYADASLTGFGWARIDDRNLVYINDSLRKMLGAERIDQALNTRFSDHMTPESVQTLETVALPHVLQDGSWQGELTLLNAAGETISTWHDVLLMLDKKGEPIYFAHAVTDNREQKRIADKLRMAKEAAESASRAKSLFLANMSHEIRTPLNAVLNMAHLCLQSKMAPKQHDYVEKIYRSGASLLGIINDILDYSKIEAGKLSLEQTPFSLADLLDDLSTLLRHRATEKNLELAFTHNEYLPMHLIGDPLRLNQVLTNLLSNAIKFTASGEVQLDIDIESMADDNTIELRFSVRDSGIGMTEAQMGNLFQPFNQADASTTRRYGGTGLGLVISKRLVEMMGGSIVVYSQPGQGTTFMFNVAFKIDRAAQPFSVPANLAGLRALIVEGHATTADFVDRILNKFGFSTERVDSAEAAADKLQTAESAYSLVLIEEGLVKPACLPGANDALAELLDDTKLHVVSLLHQATPVTGCEGCTSPKHKCLHTPVLQADLQECLEHLYSLKRENIRPAGKPTGAPPDLAGCRILLAEDNGLNQEIMKGLLEPTGARIELAEDGVVAVAMVTGQAPDYYDIVLMDIQMPEMDGLEATHRIREETAYAKLPILAMTAHALDEERQRSLAAGMNDHLTKPIEPDKLYTALLHWHLGKKAQTGAAGRAAATAPDSEPGSLGLPALPGIDVAGALARVRGKTDFYLRMLKTFVDSHGADAKVIAATLGQGEQEAARQAAHKLKGAAGNLGITEVYRAASDLEAALRQAAGDYESKSAILQKTLDATIAMLRDRLADRW